jgi:hypothetical protein
VTQDGLDLVGGHREVRKGDSSAVERLELNAGGDVQFRPYPDSVEAYTAGRETSTVTMPF